MVHIAVCGQMHGAVFWRHGDGWTRNSRDQVEVGLFLRSELNASNKCFGSGSGSVWIGFEMASLNPDPNLYREYGSGSRTVEIALKKGINPKNCSDT